MHTITTNHPTPYKIHIAEGARYNHNTITTLSSDNKPVFIITDTTVGTLHQATLAHYQAHFSQCHIYQVQPGESSKSRTTKAHIEDTLLRLKWGRNTTIIAFGGGVVTDLAGFVAATYMRGIDCILIPTTLLAMCDAAIGGKTGINTNFGKNQIGSITSPSAVIVDPEVLATQTIGLWRDGWVETIKHGIIAGEPYNKRFAQVLSSHTMQSIAIPNLLEIITQSIAIKVAIVDADPFEKGQRTCLNFGHTIGHALESCTDYRVSHGQAVAIGIAAESRLLNHAQHIDDTTYRNLSDMIQPLITPIDTPFTFEDFLQYCLNDKKNQSGITHISNINTSNTSTYLHAINQEQIRNTFTWLQQQGYILAP